MIKEEELERKDFHSCRKDCYQGNIVCSRYSCRYFIKYKNDFNCSLIAVDNNRSGLSFREIGKRIGVSPTAIENIINRIKKRLKSTLKEHN